VGAGSQGNLFVPLEVISQRGLVIQSLSWGPRALLRCGAAISGCWTASVTRRVRPWYRLVPNRVNQEIVGQSALNVSPGSLVVGYNNVAGSANTLFVIYSSRRSSGLGIVHAWHEGRSTSTGPTVKNRL
jgi:hypothetical protein